MTIKIDAVVHSVRKGKVSVDAVIDDVPTRADVDGLEVELTTVLSRHGSLTLKFTGKDLADAEKLFVQDAAIPVTFG